jgi:hypothetical protein
VGVMAKLSLSNLLKLANIRTYKEKERIDNKRNRYYRPSLSITSSEQRAMLKRSYVPTKADNVVDFNDVNDILDNTSKSVARAKVDNYRIKKLMPEINQAELILVSSILSPNDMQGTGFNITIDNNSEYVTNEEQKSDLIELLENLFINTFDIENKLSEWIGECLYGSGSKPILIIPENILTNLIKSDVQYSATEDIDVGYLKNLKLTPSFNQQDDNQSYFEAKAAMESFVNNNYNNDSENKKINQTNQIETNINKITDILQTKTCDKIEVISDIEELIINKQETTIALEEISNRIHNIIKPTKEKLKIKEDKFLKINIDKKSEDSTINPIFQELPAESVVPAFIPGTPNEHLAYFVLIDDNGNPLSLDENDLEENLIDNAYEAMFKELYYGNRSHKKQLKKQYANSINKLYEATLSDYMVSSIKSIGIKNVDIKINNAILTCMFRRLLLGKKTKILFVPRDFMVYYRFDYNEDGTGKSKLEDIKFLIAIRLTLIIAQMMSLIEEAVPKQKLSMSIDEKDPTPLKTLKNVKNEIMKNKLYNFSYDPSEIIQTMVGRSIAMEVTGGLPGLENYSVNYEDTNKNIVKPPSELSEDIKNMYNNSLGVPASALNNLNETEYASSAATTHLLYSKQINGYQKTVCNYTTSLLKKFCTYSNVFKLRALNIVKENIEKNEEVDNRTIVADIIDNIRVTLPSPNIVPNKAHYRELREMLDAFDTIYDQLYNRDMYAMDSSLGEYITTIKSIAKRDTIKEYIRKSGLSDYINIADFEDEINTKVLDVQQYLLNLKTMSDKLKEKLSANEEDSSSGSRW